MDCDLRLIDYVKAAAQLRNQPGKPGTELRIAVLRSFTCEMIDSILPVELNNLGIGCEIFFGGFNSFFQDTFNVGGEMYRIKPNIIIYAVRLEEIISEKHLYELIGGIASDPDSYLNEAAIGLESMLSFAQEKTGCKIIMHNFVKPFDASQGLHQQSKNGFNNFIRKLNLRMSEICADLGVYLMDIDDIVSDIGRINAYDPRMWELSKNPYTFTFYVKLAKLYSRYIYSILCPRKKCIILDLDNTLWRGVLGETEIDDCKPFTVFQKELKRLSQTGIILAVASKNNEADVSEFFRRHDDMPLKPEDFSVMKTNWKNKPDNISDIAKELNILRESMVFIDDNPAERELVKNFLCDVCVVDFPNEKQPNENDFLTALKGVYGLDYLELTEEDRNRNAMYREERGRVEYERSSPDMESFLRGLEMKARVSLIEENDLTRAAQLTQKTNQFNLTTKRYTEAELQNLIRNGFNIYILRLEDKFGDYGMTGLMIIEPSEDCWVIDSFLLSCRIMSRKAEYLFMAEIINEARKKSVKKIMASYIPTGKNKPVENLLNEMGFKKRDGFWEWDCETIFPNPDYIMLIRG